MFTVHIESGSLRNALQSLGRQIGRPKVVMQAAARAVQRMLVQHFRQKDATPNKLGGKRTHWWAAVARATQVASVTDDQAVISISEPGMALKVAGGTIVPKEAKMLSIPIHPLAHGRRAGTVEQVTGIKIWVAKMGSTLFLAQTIGDGTRDEKGRFVSAADGADKIRLLYVLKKSARVPPDPTALPDRGELEAEALRAAESAVTSIVRRAQAGRA